LLDIIECQDAYVIATLTQIRVNNPSLRTDFEGSVTALLSTDQLVKKRVKNGTNKLANISGILFRLGKSNITGVELRFHPTPEYSALTDDQRLELHEWRNTKASKTAQAASLKKQMQKTGFANSNKSRKRGKKEEDKLRKHIASIIAEERHKNDDSDPSTLLAFVKAVTSSNYVSEAKVSASSAEAKDLLLSYSSRLS